MSLESPPDAPVSSPPDEFPASPPAGFPVIDSDEIILNQLTKVDLPVYRLQCHVIRGVFDLTHKVVNPALEFIDCVFEDEVDLRYVEFDQTVNFTKCTFGKKFNSGDEGHSQTIYRKNLICNEAVFEAGAGFNGARCEGNGLFRGARFTSPSEEVDFSGATFANTLELDAAVFSGPANFEGLRCGVTGSFKKTRFEYVAEAGEAEGGEAEAGETGKDVVKFDGASGRNLEFIDAVFKGGASFYGCRFELWGNFSGVRFENEKHDIDFEGSTAGTVLDFNNSVFAGPANFSGVICGLGGLFKEAHFDSDTASVAFYGASFGRKLNCAGAVFRGDVILQGVKCDTAVFNQTHFEKTEGVVRFNSTTVSARLECKKAFFKGGADFTYSKWEDADFGQTEFQNKGALVDFGNSSVGWNLNCEDVLFAGVAQFDSVKCGGEGIFRNARFANDFKGDNRGGEGADEDGQRRTSFRYSAFGQSLKCAAASFCGPVSFESATISGALDLAGAKFCDTVELSNVSAKRLVLGTGEPFLKPLADLRQCSFEVYEGGNSYKAGGETKQSWEKLVAGQSPKCFSRDPYLQLEKYFRKLGDDEEADAIYLDGRNRMREHAKKIYGRRQAGAAEGDDIRWGRTRLFKDLLLKWLTGYGVRTSNLLIPIFFFVALGTLVFWPDGGLRPKPPSPSAEAQAQATAQAIVQALARSNGEPPAPSPTATPTPQAAAAPPSRRGGPDLSRAGKKLFDRLGYSVDLFIPIVDLQQADKWKAQGLGREIYSVFHITAGWLLIPLLLASISGMVKRRQ